MTLTEKRKRNEAVEAINARLAEKYGMREVNGHFFCGTGKGDIFIVRGFPSEMALVVEYADNYEEATHNLFEDGDRFYLEDYETEDDLFNAIITEIEG